MPPAVERRLREVLGWRYRPAPVDLYNAIRDVLVEAEAGDAGDAEDSSPAPDF
jgi:hypothetical protein